MKLILLFFALTLIGTSIYSQCPCNMGAAVGGLTPVGGTVNVGVLREGFVRVSTFYGFSYGNKLYKNDIVIPNGDLQEYDSHFMALLVAYGISNDFTVDAELGYFPRKYQRFSSLGFDYDIISKGLSHININAKYNLFFDLANDIELSAAAGAKIPLDLSKSELPYNLFPSSGNYGLIGQTFLHKGIKDWGMRLILYNKLEMNIGSTRNYQYGNSLQSSLFFVKGITNNFNGILEIRHDYRSKDEYTDAVIEDSGANIITLAPQLNFIVKELNISAYAGIPVYNYYFGSQLATKFSFGLNITWQSNINGD